jgi:hypothetical protein
MYSLSTGYSDHLQETVRTFRASEHLGQNANEILADVPAVSPQLDSLK